MTQNDVNFLQEALGNKCVQLLNEIVENNNLVAQLKSQPKGAEAKEPKKSKKKESN